MACVCMVPISTPCTHRLHGFPIPPRGCIPRHPLDVGSTFPSEHSVWLHVCRGWCVFRSCRRVLVAPSTPSIGMDPRRPSSMRKTRMGFLWKDGNPLEHVPFQAICILGCFGPFVRKGVGRSQPKREEPNEQGVLEQKKGKDRRRKHDHRWERERERDIQTKRNETKRNVTEEVGWTSGGVSRAPRHPTLRWEKCEMNKEEGASKTKVKRCRWMWMEWTG